MTANIALKPRIDHLHDQSVMREWCRNHGATVFIRFYSLMGCDATIVEPDGEETWAWSITRTDALDKAFALAIAKSETPALRASSV